MISFEVRGNPVAQKRHRHQLRGKHVHIYDPSSDDKDDFLMVSRQHAPERPLEGALRVDLEFYFARPKSHFRKDGGLRSTAPINHISRPDIDNLRKLVMDALNGVFWIDDSQVCMCTTFKGYDVAPRVSVTICELTDWRRLPFTLVEALGGPPPCPRKAASPA